MTVFFLAHYLEIRNSGAQYGIPVDQALAAINKALIIETNEGLDHPFGHVIVHGEVFARSEEHTSELQSRGHLVCRLLLEKKTDTSPCIRKDIISSKSLMRLSICLWKPSIGIL